MNREDFVGKTVGEIMTPETVINTKFIEDYDVTKESLSDCETGPFIRWYLKQDGNLAILYCHDNGLVLCFKDEKLITLFSVYELQFIDLSAKRQRVTASGHETNHEYWFDDGEYSRDYTR